MLRGTAVRWENAGVRRHDVAAADGSFASGVLGVGASFTRPFGAAGEVAYLCTIHPFMRGAVSVRELLLDAPAEPAVPGRPFPLHGRTALAPGTPITIEADEGGGYAPVGATTAAGDGTFHADLRPRASGRLRAVSGAAASQAVPLLVLDRKLAASGRSARGRSVVRVRVTPPGHGGTVVLQLRLRDRFGWWPVEARGARPPGPRPLPAAHAAARARPRRAHARRRRDAAGRQRAAATRPRMTAIAALWPGMPLTPPPRRAPAAHSSTRGCAVSTPQPPGPSPSSA